MAQITLKEDTRMVRRGNPKHVRVVMAGTTVDYARTTLPNGVTHVVSQTVGGHTYEAVKTVLSATPALAEPTPAPKPVQSTSPNGAAKQTAQQTLQVQHTAHQSRISGNGVDQAERRINVLEQCSRKTLDLWLLQYDIPSRLNSQCPNPSDWLWKYGYRMTLSCWILPAESLEAQDVQEALTLWRSHPGVKARLIHQDERETEQLRQIARDELSAHLIELHTSLIYRLGTAGDRLQEAKDELKALDLQSTDPRLEAPAKKWTNEVRSILREATQDFEAALTSARLFDETANVADLLSALRAAIRTEAGTFNARARVQNVKPAPMPE